MYTAVFACNDAIFKNCTSGFFLSTVKYPDGLCGLDNV